MQVTMKLLFASLFFLAAVGMTCAAEAAEPDARYLLASPEEATASDEFVEDLEVDAEWRRWDSSTVAWQTLAGLVGGTGGFFLGIPIGAAIGGATTDCEDGEWGCLGPAVLGALVGAGLGSAAGVELAGDLSGGDGHFAGTLLGTVVGAGTGLLLIGIGGGSDVGAAIVVPAAVLTTVGGGIIGYHLTSSVEISGVSVTPTERGASVGLVGRF